MLELLISFCAIGGTYCTDVSSVGNYTPQQCILQSQGEAVKWLRDHPGFQVKKISCGRLGRFAKA
jgi:hypothetical protein